MPKYFEIFLESEIKAFRIKTVQKLQQSDTEAAANGTLLSGGQWIIRERVIASALDSFGKMLIDKLRSFDVEHSTIRAVDFDLAADHLEMCFELCSSIHEEWRARFTDFPSSVTPFSTVNLKHILDMHQNELTGAKSEFLSRTSLIKRAMRDIGNRFWVYLLTLFGGIFAFNFSKIWGSLFHSPS